MGVRKTQKLREFVTVTVTAGANKRMLTCVEMLAKYGVEVPCGEIMKCTSCSHAEQNLQSHLIPNYILEATVRRSTSFV